jgi:hypothetical protein
MPHELESLALTRAAPLFDPARPRWADWVAQYRRMHEIADRYNRDVVARMRSIARAAGLDPTIPGLHARNATCSLHDGRPWRGVDYSLVRLVLWLERDVQWRAHRLVDRWSTRTFPAAVRARRATTWEAR